MSRRHSKKTTKPKEAPVLLKTPASVVIGAEVKPPFAETWDRAVKASRLQVHRVLDQINFAQIKTRKVWVRAQNASLRLSSRAKGLLWVLVPNKR